MSVALRGEDCVRDIFWKGQLKGNTEEGGRRERLKEDNQCLSGRKPQ